MAKKKTEANDSASGAGAAMARSAGPKPSRVSTKKHAKAKSIPVIAQAAVSQPIEPQLAGKPAPIMAEQDEVALVAYLYFEARGFQGGSQEEDWLRAEQEVRRRRGHV